MIVPSIDIMGGRAVQLVGGEELAIDAGDPRPLARAFGVTGEVAVIDLDAARGTGDNRELITELLELAPCRVGGGIRDVATADAWLRAGARRVILGTAATPELLSQLPRKSVIAAVDARDGRVVVEGWTRSTGARDLDTVRALAPHCGGFLVTAVEREGRLAGPDAERIRRLVEAAGDARLTIAGGVRDANDIRAADRLGADAQVGMALYSGRLSLADGFLAPLTVDENALVPTVVCDEHGIALGLAWSSRASVRLAIDERRGIYYSRSRREIWRKGATSGATQELLRVDLDCDRDTLRFTVRQREPGFCHRGAWSCWGDVGGATRLARRLVRRRDAAPAGSLTRRLLEDPALLGRKIVEEAGELAACSSTDDTVWEGADLFYFAMVKLVERGVPWHDVERELDRRERLVKTGGRLT